MCHVSYAPTPLRRLCSPGTNKTGGVPVVGAKKTVVVGVLGEDPLTARILGLLLAGAGYEARALDAGAVLEDPSTLLAGVDLVLLVPGLDDERKGEFVGVIEADPATAAVPLLGLSSGLTADPDGRAGSGLPWPWTLEALVGAIERSLLTSASGGRESSYVVAPGGCTAYPSVRAPTAGPVLSTLGASLAPPPACAPSPRGSYDAPGRIAPRAPPPVEA